MLNITSLLCDDALEAKVRRAQLGKPAGGVVAAYEVPIPLVIWAVTRASNLPCSYCDPASAATPAKNELTFDEGIALLKDLRTFRVPAVVFSGGEPLVRTDALGLIDQAAQLGLATTLNTNGMLVTDDVAGKLADIGVRLVTLPLEGGAATHDALRGRGGAHAAAITAIDRLRRRGVKVAVQFTLTTQNRPDLGELFDACIDHDVNRLTLHHLAHRPNPDSKTTDPLALEAKATRQAMDELFVRARACYEAGSNMEVFSVGNTSDAGYLILFLQKHDAARVPAVRRKLETIGGNKAGTGVACIDPTGNVHYDHTSWEYSVGNIRATPFSTLWREARDPRLAILRDRAEHLPGRCQCCQFLGVCNGNSRIRAESATGNWLGIDPACYLYETERFAGSN